MSSSKTLLPQEGTGRSAVGESLPTSLDVGSPTVSGGGKSRQRGRCPKIAGRNVARCRSRGRSSTPKGECERERSPYSTPGGSLFASDVSDPEEDLPEVYLTEAPPTRPKLKRRSDEIEEEELSPDRGSKVGTAARGRGPAKSHSGRVKPRTIPSNSEEDINHGTQYLRNSHQETAGGPLEIASHAETIRKAAQSILDNATRSGPLDSSIWANLRDNCQQLLGTASKLQEETAEAEVIRKLKADNKRMSEELALLRQETKALRSAFSERKALQENTSDSTFMARVEQALTEFRETITRDLFVSLGGMVNDRLKDAERRRIIAPKEILRPPLAADQRRLEAKEAVGNQGADTSKSNPVPTVPVTAGTTGSTLISPARAGPAPKGKKKRKRKKKKSGLAPDAASQDPAHALDTLEPLAVVEGPWTMVVRRGQGKGLGKGKQTSRKAPKSFTLPKSSAVVVTLKPESSTDYKSVMSRVTTLQLSSIGVEHAAVRRTATGARIIEIPGGDSGAAADNLADKIRELVGDVAVVSRPYKTAQIKIAGFNEAVTPEALQAEVSKVGNCPLGQVKLGQIRLAPNQTGAVIVTCPVAAANTLITAGRLLVGWSAARVIGLKALPMRCFRCMGMGHTRALCPSPVDRSDLCHRCSKAGHLTSACGVKEPWCAVCHLAKKPANHVMGGKVCNPPRTKGRLATAAPPTAPTTAPEIGGEMEQ
ncbi:uncharacterized protein LOC106133446 [Amyelois transitella]|uniref:uncharacterized protein LOC106133446 n=1 Tax=Amyelois transitella TaxID=680683 RepID=UPI00299019FC|nr:uncharacterized protein LOC106133446 [Amyelois transitella]